MLNMEKLIQKLMEEKMLFNIDKRLVSSFRKILEQKMRQGEIECYQVTDIGDCGWCVFINNFNFIIPLKNDDTALAF